jgi:hypothetical protein
MNSKNGDRDSDDIKQNICAYVDNALLTLLSKAVPVHSIATCRRMGNSGRAPHILNLIITWRWLVGFRSQTLCLRRKLSVWAPEQDFTLCERKNLLSPAENRTPNLRLFNPQPSRLTSQLSLRKRWEQRNKRFAKLPLSSWGESRNTE